VAAKFSYLLEGIGVPYNDRLVFFPVVGRDQESTVGAEAEPEPSEEVDRVQFLAGIDLIIAGVTAGWRGQ